MLYKKAKPLKDSGDVEHGYNYALFLLELRFRSQAELQDKMLKRGYKEAVIESVIKRLKDERLIDDNRLAESLIHSMKEYKYYGYMMAKKKLFEKLLPKQLIEEMLDEYFDMDEEINVAKRYVEKEFGKIPEIKKLPYDQKQKIFRRLAGRGFRLSALEFLK